MIANYHTHTWRCRHADGTEREYVERAIEGGLKILGFSDHSPYPFPDGYDSGMRMRLDQVEGYVDTVLALKKEYDKDIEIHLGLETEYFPRFWEQLIDFLSDYPFEYFVLGQHSLGNEIEKILYSGHGTTDGSYLKQYVDQCLAGIDTGKYLYLAHPELFEGRMAGVFVETQGAVTLGKTVTDLQSDKKFGVQNALVLLHLDREKFMQILKDCIRTLP